MAAQESTPLAVLWQGRRTRHDLLDRGAIRFGKCHIKARHQREVEVHMHFVAPAKVIDHILRPLVGFGKQHRAGGVSIYKGAQAF